MLMLLNNRVQRLVMPFEDFRLYIERREMLRDEAGLLALLDA